MALETPNVKAPAIYARVSSEDQVSGTSLDDQVDKCLKQAAVYGFDIPPERVFIDDGYSGATLDRPAMTRLRQAVARGEVDYVMVYKLDRLSRNIRDTLNLVTEEWQKQYPIVFRSVTEDFNTNSPLGALIFSILASFAQFERDVIRDRTENGRRRRFTEGRRAVGEPPYGYVRGPIPGVSVIHPEQAEVVRKIYNLYLLGHGFMKIATMLNTSGYRTTKGNEWTDKAVRDIAINPVYLGKVKYSGEFGDGNHEAIIDEQTFEAVQHVRMSREKVGGRSVGSPWLLGGMARCKGCGHVLFTQPATEAKRKRKDGSVYITYNKAYYACGGRLKRGTGYCTCGYIERDVLEQHVIERVKARFGSQVAEVKSVQTLQAEVDAQIRDLIQAGQRLEAAIKDKLQAVKRWEDAFESGQLDPARFGTRVANLEAEIGDLEHQKSDTASQVEELKKRQINVDWIRRVAHQVDRWEVLPEETRKQLLAYLIVHVVVWKDSQGKGKHKEETEVLVDIVWNREERSLPEGDLEVADVLVDARPVSAS